MKRSVKKELAHHILDRVNDGIINDSNVGDWHFHCFNEDHYIVGYYAAGQWLRNHQLDPFEAIGICQEWEENVFGEKVKIYDNAEAVVNMLTYIWGGELLSEIDAENIDELTESLKLIK